MTLREREFSFEIMVQLCAVLRLTIPLFSKITWAYHSSFNILTKGREVGKDSIPYWVDLTLCFDLSSKAFFSFPFLYSANRLSSALIFFFNSNQWYKCPEEEGEKYTL